MAVTQYIGSRYVPLIVGDWDKTQTYEALSVVLYQGNSYTSRQPVPAGIDIDNEQFWALTGNYNAQYTAIQQQISKLGRSIIYANDLNIASLPTGDTLVIVNDGQTHLFDNITFPSNMAFLFINGMFDGTFAIEGEIEAYCQAFSLTANVTLKQDADIRWFGAIPDDKNAANSNAIAIQNCIDSTDITRIDERLYYVGNTIQLIENNKQLIGSYENATNNDRETFSKSGLIFTNPILPSFIFMGTTDASKVITGLSVKNIQIGTTKSIIASAGNNLASGIKAVSCNQCNIVNVSLQQTHIGIEFSNMSASFIEHCWVMMDVSRTDSIGYKSTKLTERKGGIGEHASIWIKNCHASGNQLDLPTLNDSTSCAFKSDGRGLADINIENLGSTYTHYGIYLDLNNFDDSNATYIKTSNQDFVIRNCQLECVCGIYFDYSGTKSPQVAGIISQNYIANYTWTQFTTNTYAMYLKSTSTDTVKWALDITDNMFINAHVVNAYGLYMQGNFSCINIDNSIFKAHQWTIYATGTVQGSKFNPILVAQIPTGANSITWAQSPAIYMASAARCSFHPIGHGTSNFWSHVYDGTYNYCLFTNAGLFPPIISNGIFSDSESFNGLSAYTIQTSSYHNTLVGLNP